MTRLFRYQEEGIRRLVELGGRGLLADSMGLGKTVQALGVLKQLRTFPCVVVCPAGLKTHWRAEAETHYGIQADVLSGGRPKGTAAYRDSKLLVCNYEILRGWLPYLASRRPKMVIADECFPYYTPVLTNAGWLPIGEIVTERLPVLVASFDSINGVVVYRRVLHGFASRTNKRMVTIRVGDMQIVCTENHKIWTENRGYVNAAELGKGDYLRVVLPRLPGLPSPYSGSEVLLSGVPNSRQGRQDIEGEEGTAATGSGDPHEDEQSVIQPEGNSEAESHEGGEGNSPRLAWEARRQRHPDKTADHPIGWATEGLSTLGSGATHMHREGAALSDLLQGGPWQERHQTDRGDRRSGTQLEAEEGAGLQETVLSGVHWVDGVEIHQPGDRPGCGWRYPRDSWTFDIEVEEHHNYFAGGILVSNCQYVQNLKAKRTRAFRQLCQGVRSVIAISGTPLTNKVFELYPTLNTLWPAEFPSPYAFGHRYCNPHFSFGQWHYDGARNLKELHERLTSLGMVRRLKEDVLPDLPPKRHMVVPVEVEDRQQYDLAHNDLINWLRRYKDAGRAERARNAEYYAWFTYVKHLVGQLKLRAVMAWLDMFLDGGSGKILVGTVHRDVTDWLYQQFKAEAVVIHGGKSARERAQAEAAFRKSRNCRVMFGQIKAAGVGLNLPEAATVMFAEYPWTGAAVAQFIDRVHRLTSRHPQVDVYYLVAGGTIEHLLLQIIQRKFAVVGRVLDGRADGTLNVFDMLEDMLTGGRR